MDAPDFGARYLPLYRLAAGGMAEVWVGAQRVAAARRPVAIKRILPQFAEEEKYVRMFLDEAHLAACIDSPNVVSLIDAEIADDGAPFLVMELVEGLPFSALMRSKTVSLDEGTVCHIIREAALGLHDAHEARSPSGEHLQLVHRDVSPQNLLVGVDGRVRLADFGVAHALERMTLTIGGEFKGKLGYCAPEQLRGQADRRADIFSLGVVIRQAFSGERLFGPSSGNAEAVHKLLHEEIAPTHSVAPHVDKWLAAVVDKALSRDPADRYSNAAAFAEALVPFASATRTSLGKLVVEAGGEVLRERREKTGAMFAALKDEDVTALSASLPPPPRDPEPVAQPSAGTPVSVVPTPTTDASAMRSRAAAVIGVGVVVGAALALGLGPASEDSGTPQPSLEAPLSNVRPTEAEAGEPGEAREVEGLERPLDDRVSAQEAQEVAGGDVLGVSAEPGGAESSRDDDDDEVLGDAEGPAAADHAPEREVAESEAAGREAAGREAAESEGHEVGSSPAGRRRHTAAMPASTMATSTMAASTMATSTMATSTMARADAEESGADMRNETSEETSMSTPPNGESGSAEDATDVTPMGRARRLRRDVF